MKKNIKRIVSLSIIVTLYASPVLAATNETTTKLIAAPSTTTTTQPKLIAIPSTTTTTTQPNATTTTAPAKATTTQPATVTTPTKTTTAQPATTAAPAKATTIAPAATKAEEAKTPETQDKSVIARIKNAKVGIENYFVSVKWLKENIKSCVVVDCRPSSLYKGGHIPGAVNAEWTYFAKMNVPNGTEKWGTVLSPATLSARIGALGINASKTVVLYCDDKGWGQSGWALWVLKQTGLQKVYVLDGGYTEWKQNGGTVSKTATKAKPVAFKVTKYIEGFSIDTETLSKNLDKVYILDVRTRAEYCGKIRPFQEKRTGHIPGAVNIEKDSVVNDENLVKVKAQIDELLSSVGIGKDKPIVVYDTAGVRSAFVTMVLCCFGYHATNYDAGFQAWAGNPDLPVEK
ncbi:MAG: rhodanese-like domain-containing protein [Synergistaceae bacterium]|nr:rhodanese-like domain-containing protein [Synergistaceae bacterium]